MLATLDVLHVKPRDDKNTELFMLIDGYKSA